jgi:O-antigen/teichoic acid export membrane protein
MNPLRRLLTNTALIFIANAATKVSDSLLFIMIGRILGPLDAGVFNLARTFLVIFLTMSAWGLHELLVRELAPRRSESGRYLVNYTVMRFGLALIAFLALTLILQLNLPYSQEAKATIRILSLAIFPEALYAIIQAFFVAHERVTSPLAAALANSTLKLAGAYWVLDQGGSAVDVARVVVIASSLSLFLLLPGLVRILRDQQQSLRRQLDLRFGRQMLGMTPGFIVIGLFATLDYQTDAVLISLLLDEKRLGWYGAAQTLMLGFWLLPIAIRTALYPLMSRYHQEDRQKLIQLYQRANQYLIAAALPVATVVTILALPLVRLVFGRDFDPAAPALQIMIWAVVFAFLDVPNARLMLINNAQSRTGWITGLSMATNLAMNLVLTPHYGILGAAVSRAAASFVFFLVIYLYVQRHFIKSSLLPLTVRPLIASTVMAPVVWLMRDLFVLWPLLAGLLVYCLLIVLLGGIPARDIRSLLA